MKAAFGFLGLLVLLFASYGWVERERQEAVDAAQAETLDQIENLIAQTIQRADRLAARNGRRMDPLPIMTRSDEEALRRFRNEVHVTRARELGTRARDQATTDSLVALGELVALEDSTRYWIVRRGASPARVVPHLEALLEILGQRFQERLAEEGLPPYRFEVTSALRTTERQAELRESNSNAAAGVSSHEFGTTVDVSYAAFAPPAQTPEELLRDVPDALVPHFERIADLAFESVSARKSRELGGVFGEVLTAAQAEGLAVLIYERQQTVYHLTVARALAEPGAQLPP